MLTGDQALIPGRRDRCSGKAFHRVILIRIPLDATNACMQAPRLIKRYPNRKLYDTDKSRYITLDDVADLVRQGVELRILDNATGQDLTSVTLAQVLLDDVKRKRGIPLAALRRLIQDGSASLGELVSQLGRDIDQTVGRVLGRQDQTEQGADGARGVGETHGGVDIAGSLATIREWVSHSQHSLEEWQGRVDDQIRRLAESLSPVLRLQRQMAELEERVRRLESERGWEKSKDQ